MTMQNNNNNSFTRKTIHEDDIERHLEKINQEFHDGFEFLKKYPKSVSIFGSSIISEEHPAGRSAKEISRRIVDELGYAVVTGGGLGIMNCANKGAYEAGGPSIGLNIVLPHESEPNGHLTDNMKFTYFFSRKTMLTFAAETYIFMPGGFGTFDELFSILTLIQTHKIHRVPIVLFDTKFWYPFIKAILEVMSKQYKTIDPEDMALFEVTDDIDRVLEIVKTAPVSEWWRHIN
jgi:uncharacterized protein (TIGR00730 family)